MSEYESVVCEEGEHGLCKLRGCECPCHDAPMFPTLRKAYDEWEPRELHEPLGPMTTQPRWLDRLRRLGR